MKSDLTPRRRVELALQKKFVDKVPFTSIDLNPDTPNFVV